MAVGVGEEARHPTAISYEKKRGREAVLTGIVTLLLALHCRLTSGKALPMNKQSLLCQNIRHRCNKQVCHNIQCQVSRLNTTAENLFNLYLKCQKYPFDDKKQLDNVCKRNNTFPHFSGIHSCGNETLVALYKIFAFFNASLVNITRNQKDLSQNTTQDNLLLKHLRTTANETRGLLSNLACLLCSQYNVTHIDVTYGKSSGKENNFEKKQEGCQVLRWYSEVVSSAARTTGKCNKQA
ncbi:leukemia inhibitory factor [Hemicordylus capensis]|uniref:leukemia inhibitory factor n=1 Tax=Hemicordylus capensis TaxID=884348 RepID=UPI00230405F2|nr:leukemia inhibitory factor [Hemicordylus capensis]